MATLFVCFVFFMALTAGQTQQHDSNIPAKEVIETLVSRLDHLETTQMKQQHRFNTERLEQKTRIEALEATVRRQNDVITELLKVLYNHGLDQGTTRQGAGERMVSGNKIAVQQNDNQGSTRRHAKQHDEKRAKRQTQVITDLVAFSAMADHSSDNWRVQLDAKKYFIFDVLYIDTHSAYNNQTGRFTAPIEGIYAISVSIMAFNNHEVYGDVFINGVKNVARVYARGTDGRHDQGSQTVLLRLYPGDWVAVQNPEPFGETVFGGFYTSFSGFLVKQEGQLRVVG